MLKIEDIKEDKKEKQKIIFIKDVDFMDIHENDIFPILYDKDNLPYITIKNRRKLYLSKRRDSLNYYKRLHKIKEVKKENGQNK